MKIDKWKKVSALLMLVIIVLSANLYIQSNKETHNFGGLEIEKQTLESLSDDSGLTQFNLCSIKQDKCVGLVRR